ncbi:Mpo1-like protein [Mucilaginibacter sp. CAU 1740]|uniref:Mpo1-like protein n=1 Tax=Mucilaginibacter sp. CAU 1740 TaxID=3140365 RepID=UPI00325AB2AB
MATKTSNTKTKPVAKATANVDERPVDRHFREYAASHQDPVNTGIHYFCIPLLAFSLFGLIWAIPFPHLPFLGVYNGYFNWASFVIAIVIYFYLKLSPIISYFILFILLGFSYGIMELVNWQQTSGPAMWMLCLSIFIPSVSALLIGNSRESTYAQNGLNIKSLVIAPAYLLNQLLNKLRIKN